MNLWIVFLTGLTTGGLSCLAVQGGLLAGLIANQKGEELRDGDTPATRPRSFDRLDWMPVTLFLIAKLIVHTLFGALLGALGSVLSLSLGVRLAFQAFTALFMIATALNLLHVHPIFRYMAFQPPRFVRRWIRGSTNQKAFFAPAVLGLMTVFIPCGVTQAMEVLAINSGSAVTGALIMFFFVLGTSPLFSLIGVATAKLSEALRGKFLKFAAIVLVGMALYSVNGVLQVLDAPVTAQKVFAAIRGGDSSAVDATTGGGPNMSVEDVQRVTIDVRSNGYTPNRFRVASGKPVVLTVQTNDVYTCAASFTFRAFGIFTTMQPTDRKVFTFTPQQKGTYTFSCSMGMYTGTMEVI
ncbi:MAG: sulfite exporter TauE/SafE family protein [Candidatus Kerfeldbacteria bacterium]|nr:sulfite exporter TauE/SafE family protein [Candidatus Kerfeldbacteria bacterium]